MPRCPAGAMDEGPVDLRTRPKAAGPPGAALPLRKRPLREPSPEPAAPRGAAGPLVGPDPLGGGPDSPAVPAAPHGLARPEALYYQGPLLPIYPTPNMGSLFPLLNLPTPLYSMVYSMEHPLSADIAVATHADEDGDTPLHIAVVQGNLPAVHRLVNLFQHGGRELDIYNNLRQTPLHLAVITTLPSMVRLLVMAGASPMALDRHGQTAAHLACEHRSPTCLRALLDSAAPGTVDLEARNYDGLTALHVAVNMQCPEAVLLLLERGADIDAVDIKSGRSPLIHAVENNSLSMVQLLLQASLCQPSDFSPEAALLSRAFSLAFPRPQNEPGPAATTALLTLPPALSFRPPRLWTFPSSEGAPPRAGRDRGRAAAPSPGWSARALASSLPSPTAELHPSGSWPRWGLGPPRPPAVHPRGGRPVPPPPLTRPSRPAARRQRERADVLGQLGAALGVRPRAPPAGAHAGPQRRRQRPQELPQRHAAHGGTQPPGHRHPEGEGDPAGARVTARALAGTQRHHLPREQQPPQLQRSPFCVPLLLALPVSSQGPTWIPHGSPQFLPSSLISTCLPALRWGPPSPWPASASLASSRRQLRGMGGQISDSCGGTSLPCGVNPPRNCEDLTLPPPFRTRICTEAQACTHKPPLLSKDILLPPLNLWPPRPFTPVILRRQSPVWNSTQIPSPPPELVEPGNSHSPPPTPPAG